MALLPVPRLCSRQMISLRVPGPGPRPWAYSRSVGLRPKRMCATSSGEPKENDSSSSSNPEISDSPSSSSGEDDPTDEAPKVGQLAAAAAKKLAGRTEAAKAAALEDVLVPEDDGKFPHRWKVVLLMALAFVLCNMDKVNMSVAVIPMAKDLGWSALDRGLVSSSFFWGYTLTQIPGGYISTKIGGARVLMAGVALWSFGTLIAPPAAKISLWALCATRVLVGLGEGVAPSAATTVLAKMMPRNERSRAVAMVWGGLDVGSVVGLLLSGPLIKAYGWPSVFYLFACLGLMWCVVWPMIKPEMAPSPKVAEQSAMVQTVEEPVEKKEAEKIHVPWAEFFKSVPVWAVTVAHFCFNWGYYVLLAWLPSYFELALGLNVQKSSFLTLIPYLAMTAMMPLVGPVADGLVEKGMPLTKVRKLAQGIAFIGPAMCMLACAFLTPAGQGPAGGVADAAAAANAPVAAIVTLLSVSFALGAWSRAGLYCNHQDLSPKYAGALLGITNTAGALPGVLGVTAAGYLLDQTNSWALALFLPTAVCQIFGAIFYTIFASSERQSWS
eukprot:gene2986-12994_t